MTEKIKIAVLDDYQHLALSMGDWSSIPNAEVTVFDNHIKDPLALEGRLRPFDVICLMRERTPLNKTLINGLPNLKLVVSTGARNASIDEPALHARGIELKPTRYVTTGAPEFTWALLMALARNIVPENTSFRSGGWQRTLGIDLDQKTLGIVGLGRIGSRMAEFGKVFNMKVIAWSENLTVEKAAAAGVELVSKEQLFRGSDFITIHLVLSERSRGIIGEADLQRMKSTAFLLNTSRGPLIKESALISALQQKKIAGAALDVFDEEPLPADHPFRTLDNLLATPHIGYVTEHTYRVFYEDTVKAIREWGNSRGNKII